MIERNSAALAAASTRHDAPMPIADDCLRHRRLDALDAMAPTLIHELAQPLSAATNYLQGCAAQLRQRIDGMEDMLAMIERANAQAVRAREIIERMRNFALSGRVASQPEELRGIVERALAAVPFAAKVAFLPSYHATGTYVIADRVQIEQVLTNLFANAVQAMEASPVRRLKLTTSATEDRTLIQIEDSGPGLSREAFTRLFEPFFTTKPFGTGLGLSICRTIVEAHGGRLWANRPVAGRGAIFNLALPATMQGE